MNKKTKQWNWNEMLNASEAMMRKYAERMDKKVSKQEKSTKDFHEIKLSLSSRSKSETEEKHWKKPDGKMTSVDEPQKTPVLTSALENNRDNFKEPLGFGGIEEEFGYYREWKPNEEPTNTVYHKKREGGVFIERKRVWKDNNQTSSMEIEDTEMIEAENSQQTQGQTSSNSQLASYQKSENKSGDLCVRPNFPKNEVSLTQSKTNNYIPYVVGGAGFW